MPWGWECREKHVKQRVLKPTQRHMRIASEVNTPGPTAYTQPDIVGGPGYSKIKRMPAYTFRPMTKMINKPAARLNAPMFDVSGIGPKGRFRVPGSVVTPQLAELTPLTKVPGPGTYVPQGDSRYKRPPAYTMRVAARPPYQPWDQWTPPPNMYLPPIPEKRPPAYTFGDQYKPFKIPAIPGPGTHDPNFNFVKNTKAAYSFGYPFRPRKPAIGPAPNTYCERKFCVSKPTAPAPSFGIRHTPYLGEQNGLIKPPNLELQISRAT